MPDDTTTPVNPSEDTTPVDSDATKKPVDSSVKTEPDLEPEVRSKEETKPVEETPTTETEEITPEDEAAIGRVVKKELGSVNQLKNDIRALKDEREVDTFLLNNPDMVKYRATALKYMSHPAYSNIPAQNIFAIVAGKDLMKIGAEREREAQKKAADTKDTGVVVRKADGSTVDWKTASKEEIEAQKAKIFGRQT